MENEDLLGKGIYKISDVARIVHAYPQSVRRWSEGYSFKTNGKRITSAPVLLTPTLKFDEASVLTFQQLIEIVFIRLFRSKGVAMPVIRAATRRASQRFQSDHPFAVEGLKTDGKSIFLISPSDIKDIGHASAVESLEIGQMVMGDIVQRYFKQMDYEDFEVSRYWPLKDSRRIVLDPKRSFGQAIDVESGIPTRVLYGKFAAGEPLERIVSWYNVERQSIIDAVKYEQRLRMNPSLPFAA